MRLYINLKCSNAAARSSRACFIIVGYAAVVATYRAVSRGASACAGAQHNHNKHACFIFIRVVIMSGAQFKTCGTVWLVDGYIA